MLIRKLVLKNYSIHPELELTFTPGINGILGPNGSGKSTILDAVRFAITGVSVLEGSLKDNVTWGEKAGSVWVEFSHGDSIYSIQRKIGKTTSQVLVTPTQEFTKQAEIQSQMEALFGTTFEALLNNVFVPQGRIESILFATNTQRLREIQRVVGLDSLATAEKALGLEINSIPLTPGLSAQISEMSTLAAQARQELGVATVELEALDVRMRLLQPAVTRLEEFLAVERSRTALLRVEQDITEATQLVSELSGACSRLETEHLGLKTWVDGQQEVYQRATSQLAAFDANKRQASVAAGIRSSLAKADAILAQAPSTLPNVEDMRGRLDKLKASLDVRAQQLAGTLPRPKLDKETVIESRLQELESEIRATKTPPALTPEEVRQAMEKKELQRQLEIFSTGKCPTCNQPVHDFDVETAKATIEELGRKIQQAQEARQTEYEATRRLLLSEQLELRKELAEVGTAASTVLQSAVKKLATQVEALAAELKQGSTLLDTLMQARRDREIGVAQLSELGVIEAVDADSVDAHRKTVGAVEDARSKLNEVTTKLVLERGRLEQAVKSLSQAKALREGFGALQTIDESEMVRVKAEVQEFHELRTQQQRLQTAVGIGQARVQSLTESVERLNIQFKDEGYSRKWVEVCRRVRDIVHVSGLPTLMMREYATILNRRMAHYLQVWEAPFRMELDETLAFVVYFEGGKVHSANRLSGGQQIVASTSFRLAMVETFARDLGFLVLDEPSNYLDSDNIHHLQQLLLRLRELASASGRQILLVTHEASLGGFFDNTINLYR